MTGDVEGGGRPPPSTQSDPPVRPGFSELFTAIAAPRRAPPAPADDVLELFDRHLEFVGKGYPDATPSSDGGEHLDELARLRFKHLERRVTLETAERVVAMAAALLARATPLAAIALLGRHVGAW